MNRHSGCPAGQVCDVLQELELDEDLLSAAITSSAAGDVPLCHELVAIGAVPVDVVMGMLSARCAAEKAGPVAEAGVMASLASSLSLSVRKRCERVADSIAEFSANLEG